MKTMMKKTAAYLLALLLVIQMVPAFADGTASEEYSLDVAYRDAIEIVSQNKSDILKVGMSDQLSVSNDYNSITWESNHPEIATVDENGLVKAVGEGKVTITVTSEGKYTDTISFKVIADTKAEEPKTEPAGQTEGAGNGQGGVQNQDEKIIIFIKGKKTKVEYNGQIQKNEYTVSTSNDALFEENKLRMVNDHLAEKKDCGIWQDEMSEADFVYDGNAEIVVSNGWINIRPVQIEIKADDVTIEEGETPVFTASVTKGLVEGDTLDLSGVTFSTNEFNGMTLIIPDVSAGDIIGNYKVSKADNGVLTVNAKQMNEYPLYNLAVINNTWYRLGKTSINTEKTLDEYLKGITKDGNVKVVNDNEYQAALYDFDDLEIVVNGKKYIYNCDKNAETILLGADYYTASLKNVEAVLNKIGGMNGNNPRWLIPADQQYGDPNKTSSFHMNYTITLHEAEIKAEDQDIYYMLSVDGSQDYYKLNKGTITAKPYDKVTIIDQRVKQVKESDYVLKEYDFTNTVITIDGVDYKYNDGSLDEYENYFTATFDMVVKSERFNGNDAWFKKAESWLDDAYTQYGNLPNNTKAFHANYKATTHKAVARPERNIELISDYSKATGYIGLKITLTAQLTGFDGLELGKDYRLIWQYSPNKGSDNWINIEGEEGMTFSFILDEVTTKYSWRVIAEDIE